MAEVLIVQQVLNGLALGMAYALIAVGYSLVFGILRLVNFSHGSIYAFGAHAALLFVGFEFGVLPAILLSMVCTGLLGILIDKAALEPLRKKNSVPIAALITTIGVSNIIQNLLMIWFGSEKKAFPAVFNLPMIEIGGFRIQSTQLMMCVVSLILLLVLTLVINKTKIGLAMRATEQNPKAAKLMGVNVNFVISFTFFLAGASAAIAGGGGCVRVPGGNLYQLHLPGFRRLYHSDRGADRPAHRTLRQERDHKGVRYDEIK